VNTYPTQGNSGLSCVFKSLSIRFVDFVKVGLPLLIVTLVLTMLVVPLFFPF
jgi:di/tricarboxylate transporter